MIVRQPFAWLWGLLPSFLSFALQLALGMQVPVGSFLPYGSHPLQWDHPCGVEAGEVLDRYEGLLGSSFHYGLILRDAVTLWVETVFSLILDRNEDFSAYLFGWFRAFAVASPLLGVAFALWASALVRIGGLFSDPYASVLRDPATLWVARVDQFPLARVRWWSLVVSPSSFRMGFEPLSEASLRTLSLAAQFLVFLSAAASLREFTTLLCSSLCGVRHLSRVCSSV